ncbi:sulfotransferase domain-containing protein [Salinibacter ruber]|uniref:sulfotransferase domain-containing protein n=1 Tax=Salinibacter ruber TaxID=146919 RepID=UPI003C6E62CC
MEWLNRQGTVFYIYRDGRDVLCSYQLFRQKFDPDAEGPIGAFIRQDEGGTNRARRWAEHVQSWLRDPEVHGVQFERLLDQPKIVIRELADKLGLNPIWREPLLPRPFQSIWQSRWARLFRMRPESTAIINGARQEWQDTFSAEDRQFFHREAGDVLIDLGYVDSAAWVDGRSSDLVDSTS